MIRLLITLLLSYSLFAHAFTTLQGHFEATKTCPAYLSKNKKTNPDNLETIPSQTYSLVEINRPNNPDWVRLVFPEHGNTKRWVSINCGHAQYESQDTDQCNQSAGMADSYVLALSWQPAFCQTYGYEAGKPECLKLNPQSYQASHLVLHGLWPNQDNCGQSYGFCDVEPKRSHCAYPALSLNPTVDKQLRTFMPSYAFGSCLERHEWYKHGSCQVLSPDAYFSLAVRLTQEANAAALGQFLHQHVGETVSRKQLQDVVRQSFGNDATSKVYLGCKNGLLVDIFIQLPALIPYNEPLEALVNKAPELNRYEGCPASIGISNFSSSTLVQTQLY